MNKNNLIDYVSKLRSRRDIFDWYFYSYIIDETRAGLFQQVINSLQKEYTETYNRIEQFKNTDFLKQRYEEKLKNINNIFSLLELQIQNS